VVISPIVDDVTDAGCMTTESLCIQFVPARYISRAFLEREIALKLVRFAMVYQKLTVACSNTKNSTNF
jgi:hypothetical protein